MKLATETVSVAYLVRLENDKGEQAIASSHRVTWQRITLRTPQ